MRQLYLLYNDTEINNTTYVLEYTSNEKTKLVFFDGLYSYAKALIYAYEFNISGYIIYCLTRSRIKIVNGLPLKRGRKPQNKTKSPFSVLETPPELMKPLN